jgi:hypothetical protein
MTARIPWLNKQNLTRFVLDLSSLLCVDIESISEGFEGFTDHGPKYNLLNNFDVLEGIGVEII